MIQFQNQEYSDEEIFNTMNPLLSQWFKQKFKTFTAPQKYAILNIHCGENTLISAPTGTGKTLPAFAAVLNELISLSEAKLLEDKVYCVYVSPLKALSRDIEKNLNEPLSEITEMAEKLGKKIRIKEINSESPSPFAFNLYAQGYSDVLKMEGRIAFIQRMHEKVLKKIEAKSV